MANSIQRVSFSMLMLYEQCPFRVKLRYIDKSPEPPRKPDDAAERGNREHARLERFVKGDARALDDSEGKKTKEFLPILEKLRDMYTNDIRFMEME